MSETLKTCPFCGGEADFRKITNSVSCNRCYAHTPWPFNGDETDAAKAWNRRAETSTQKALALAKGELKKIEVAGRGGWENAIAIQALRQIAEIERGGE